MAIDLKLMKFLFRQSQSSLKQILVTYLQKNDYKKIIIADHYIIAEGDLPVCLVAHLDTIFDAPPQDIYYDNEKQVLWSPQGLGADDRAGVFAIVKIINDKFKPSIIFTLEEELGGLGAQELILDYPKYPFKKIKAIIELDRSGYNDCVFYFCKNAKFKNYIQAFGFKETMGTFSDISILAPSWNIAAVNLSVGYFGEHTPVEYLHLNALANTINKVEQLLNGINNIPSYFYY